MWTARQRKDTNILKGSKFQLPQCHNCVLETALTSSDSGVGKTYAWGTARIQSLLVCISAITT